MATNIEKVIFNEEKGNIIEKNECSTKTDSPASV